MPTQGLGFLTQKGQIWSKIYILGHFGPNIGIFGPFRPMPVQKTMQTRCLGGFSVIKPTRKARGPEAEGPARCRWCSTSVLVLRERGPRHGTSESPFKVRYQADNALKRPLVWTVSFVDMCVIWRYPALSRAISRHLAPSRAISAISPSFAS